MIVTLSFDFEWVYLLYAGIVTYAGFAIFGLYSLRDTQEADKEHLHPRPWFVPIYQGYLVYRYLSRDWREAHPPKPKTYKHTDWGDEADEEYDE